MKRKLASVVVAGGSAALVGLSLWAGPVATAACPESEEGTRSDEQRVDTPVNSVWVAGDPETQEGYIGSSGSDPTTGEEGGYAQLSSNSGLTLFGSGGGVNVDPESGTIAQC